MYVVCIMVRAYVRMCIGNSSNYFAIVDIMSEKRLFRQQAKILIISLNIVHEPKVK